jgi:hypothetical protein
MSSPAPDRECNPSKEFGTGEHVRGLDRNLISDRCH